LCPIPRGARKCPVFHPAGHRAGHPDARRLIGWVSVTCKLYRGPPHGPGTPPRQAAEHFGERAVFHPGPPQDGNPRLGRRLPIFSQAPRWSCLEPSESRDKDCRFTGRPGAYLKMRGGVPRKSSQCRSVPLQHPAGVQHCGTERHRAAPSGRMPRLNSHPKVLIRGNSALQRARGVLYAQCRTRPRKEGADHGGAVEAATEEMDAGLDVGRSRGGHRPRPRRPQPARAGQALARSGREGRRIERVLEAHATPDSTAALERGLRQAQEQVTHLERIVEALPDPPPPPPDPPPA
jgi:hypothetical protein